MAHPHNAELALSVFLKHFAQWMKKKFMGPLYGWGLLRGGSLLLPLIFQKLLVLILSTSEGWKGESNPVLLNTGSLDLESSALTTRSLLHINGFSENIFCLGQMGHLGSRKAHRASQLWIRCKDCLQFFIMKGTKRDILLALVDFLLRQIILMFFLKEILFRAIW